MSLSERVCRAFREELGGAPALLVRAPGRVNLLGEHTDYNEGVVLPMAIERAVWIALRPRPQATVRALSLTFEPVEFALDALEPGQGPAWGEYLKGVAWALQEAGYSLQGWEGVVGGDVPIGAGLSSSAALEVAAARAFAAVSGWSWQARRMAQLAQRAENHWVGVHCGIMDQLTVAAGRAGHALLIDCRTLEVQPVPLPLGVTVVILDTGTRRGLRTSAYNERRAACQEAARLLGVPTLRDVTMEQFLARAGRLAEPLRRRARHVIGENERVLQAVAAMRRGDVAALGRLLEAGHASLRDDFEVSSPALDAIVACARQAEGCYGARMTGAGFGGCAVALVEGRAVDAFIPAVSRCYQAATGRRPALYPCRPAEGVEVHDLGRARPP